MFERYLKLHNKRYSDKRDPILISQSTKPMYQMTHGFCHLFRIVSLLQMEGVEDMSGIDFYRCETCGNVLARMKGDHLSRACCTKTLTKLETNITDGETEQHSPMITRNSSDIQVSVGSVLHPMLPEHHIEWIALDTGDRTDIVYFKADTEPRAAFSDVSTGVVYAYCNLHGLWKVKF